MPRLKNEMYHKGKRVYIHILLKYGALGNTDGRVPRMKEWVQARKAYSKTLATERDVQACRCGMHASDNLYDAKYFTAEIMVGDSVCLVELKGNVQAHTRSWEPNALPDKYVALYRKIVAKRKVTNAKERAWLINNAKNNTKIRKWILRQYKKG